MARKKKTAKPKKSRDPEAIRRRNRFLLHTFGVVLLLGSLGYGYWQMKKYVDREIAFSTRPPTIVIKDRPAWMTEALAIEIINSIKPIGPHSTYDHKLLEDTATSLAANPWVKKVNQIRRAYSKNPGDTLEIDCDFRAPIALVHWKDYFWLVGDDSRKLPEQYTASQLPAVMKRADGSLNLRIVEGIFQPPVEAGRLWTGDDLAAGLDMARLLYGRKSLDDVTRIDVSNFGGRVSRREAQITLITTKDTQIRWGQPVNSKDYLVEVPTTTKLKNLEEIVAQYGRPDGGMPWIDIRFDRVTYPSSATASVK